MKFLLVRTLLLKKLTRTTRPYRRTREMSKDYQIKVYSASWCEPCKQLKLLLTSEGVTHTVIDIDKDPESSRLAGVRGIPTVIREDTGQRLVGAVTAEQLRVFMARG
jgi:glutaredoxin